jgi:ribosomal protein L37E
MAHSSTTNKWATGLPPPLLAGDDSDRFLHLHGCGQPSKVSKTVNSCVALLRMHVGPIGSLAFDKRIERLLVHVVTTWRKCCVPDGKSVPVQCLRCGHFSVLTPDMLSRLAIAPNTPIAAFVKRLRCRRCGSQSVLATRKPHSSKL